MKRNLLLFFTLITATLFLTTQSANAQACGDTIDAVSAPVEAPVDADGNNTAYANGTQDAAYAQAELPNASLPNVSYIVEFSNGSPLEINETGTWNSIEQGLQANDTVKVRAFTYHLDSINLALDVAYLLCPFLDGQFPDLDPTPCSQIVPLAEGDSLANDPPGLQGLDEALGLAAALTGVEILSSDSAKTTLNNLNKTLAENMLDIIICFNLTDTYSVIITQDPNDTDSDGIADADEDVDGDGDNTNDDTDGDEIPNFQDNDDDGDGILTGLEDAGDTDGDEITNALDNDDDGDGILTADEADEDTDGDGVINALDNDDDGDTIPTADELDEDTDGDGITNALDDDDNGDDIPTADQNVDSDMDGTIDYLDDDIMMVGIYEQYIAISVYPNPNFGVFTVDLNQLNEIEIFNHIGQAIDFSKNGNTITLNQANKGVYFVKMSTLSETYITKISVK